MLGFVLAGMKQKFGQMKCSELRQKDSVLLWCICMSTALEIFGRYLEGYHDR